MRHAGNARQTEQTEFTINDLSKMYGVTLRALRYYENKGLISPMRRGIKRIYNEMDRAHLECVLKGKRCGYSLFEIGRMMRRRKEEGPYEGINAHDMLLTIEPMQIEQQIRFLEARRLEVSQARSELRAVARQRYNNLH